MDVEAIIKQLHATGSLTEMAHVTAFQGERTTEDGEEVPVRVAILDYGAEAPDGRYQVIAEDDDGAIAAGDAAATVAEAIDNVDWTNFELDEEDDDVED